MPQPTLPACACVNCPGSSCTCGCQTPTTAQAAPMPPQGLCACGDACACRSTPQGCRCG